MKSMDARQIYADSQALSGPRHVFIPLFSQRKIAGAHKSSPAVGKAEGCSCEAALDHIRTLTKNRLGVLYSHLLSIATGIFHKSPLLPTGTGGHAAKKRSRSGCSGRCFGCAVNRPRPSTPCAWRACRRWRRCPPGAPGQRGYTGRKPRPPPSCAARTPDRRTTWSWQSRPAGSSSP